jgi:hypothetical protein
MIQSDEAGFRPQRGNYGTPVQPQLAVSHRREDRHV